MPHPRIAAVLAASLAAVLTAASCGPTIVYPPDDTPAPPARSATPPQPATAATAVAAPTAAAAPTTRSQTASSVASEETAAPSPDVPDTTAAPPTTEQPPSQPPARPRLADLLALIVVADESHHDTYDRDTWSHWNTGADPDDGLNTRHEVLAAQSVCAPVVASGAVRSGCWHSVYDNAETTDPGDLHIDHIVALAEAHQSGGHAWDAARRELFANDPSGLVAVTAATNMAKSADDPSQWMPPHQGAHCDYLVAWTAVKAAWGLTMDTREHTAIANRVNECDAATP